ncbi:MAG: rhodanese-like domain-containing protein [Planctomycetaceae bacterium]
MTQTITCRQLAELGRNGNVELIDVRTSMEFRHVHAVGARSVPLDSLDVNALMAARNGNSDEPLYVICRSGSRAKNACRAFHEAGFTNVVNVEGGTLAWEQAGLPVNRGASKMISLERQVRIAAGLLIVLGAVLAVTVDRWFAGLSGFVGAGLLFSGIADNCAMGLMLAKMPWNRGQTGDGCSHN